MTTSVDHGICPDDRSTHEAGYPSLEAAANWYACLHSDDVSTADQHAWQTWLEASAEHARAWSYIVAVSRRFAPLRDGGHQAALAGINSARRGRPGRRQVVAGLAGVLGLGLVGWLGWRHGPLPEAMMAWGADYRTVPGEQQAIRLADDTQVWLNTDSALSVDYQPAARRLRLITGEVLVQTAPDAQQRPFYIETRNGRVQALGTRFSVHHDHRRTRINVFQNAVEVRNAAGAVQRIEAGQRIEFDADGLSAIAPAERAREAWYRGVVVADNISLRQLIDDLARYQSGYIHVAPDVADLRVVGVFPANDSARALSMLEHTLPVRIKRILPWWTTVEAINAT